MKKITVIVFLTLVLFVQISTAEEINLETMTIYELKDFEIISSRSSQSKAEDQIRGMTYTHLQFKGSQDQHLVIKKDLTLSGPLGVTDSITLSLYNFSPAFEIYWDGREIGAAGKMANEGVLLQSAPVRYSITIPHNLVREGNHTLLIKFIFRPMAMVKNGGVYLGRGKVFDKFLNEVVKERLFYFGFFLVIAFFCLALYFTGMNNPSYLYFGIYTGFYCFISLWVFLIEGGEISLLLYRWIEPILRNSDGILGIILILFLLWHFKSEHKRLYILLSLFFLLLSFIIPLFLLPNIRFSGYFIVMPFNLIGLLVIIDGVRRKIPGAFIALFSFILIIISDFSHIFKEMGLFEGEFIVSAGKYITTIFILTLLLSVIVKIQAENKRYNEMQIRSNRLEAEMLKQSIQPHFILNTLLSVKSMLRHEGQAAEELIDSLADEFGIIREISTMEKIPLSRELELCKLHLKIMGFRRSAKYKLIISSSNKDVLLPPLILHTLIENGITHSFQPKENGEFYLDCQRREDKLDLQLRNGGSKIAAKEKAGDKIEEGTGLGYIRSRLMETYGNDWQLDYRIEREEWIVKMVIPFEVLYENSDR